MEWLKIFFLGIIQGITEFLPISSSGHLVIFQRLFGISSNQLTINVFLHIGTVIPVIIIFWNDIRDILLFKKEKRRLTWLIIFGIIPTGLIGLYFKDFFEGLFTSVRNVGFMLLITGLLLLLSEKISRVRFNIDKMKGYNAVIVGIAQGLAVIPGISRSGSTIAASLLQGLDRESAARYSFLISLPVILGAGLVELKDLTLSSMEGLSWSMLITGMLAAAISGYFAIKYLIHILKKGSLVIFTYYCWGLGFLIILLAGLL